MMTRRTLLAGAAATALTPVGASERETLASAAQRAGLVFGASIDRAAFDDPGYFELYRRETQMFVTDVALKFDWLRPAPDVWNFAPADRIVAAAKAEIQQEVARAKESLRNSVADLAVAGAAKILKREVDAKAHADLLREIQQQL